MSPVRWAIAVIIVILLVCTVAIAWFTTMPSHSYSGPLKPLSSDEATIRDDLSRHAKQLAETIGVRNMDHYESLKAAADYLETTLHGAGYDLHSYEYSVEGNKVRNIEVQIAGAKSPADTVVVGAHYDTFGDSPGADDNASGVAAVLELAQ
ncbi:MAG TPA: M28 family peptidase [Candidatus Angelobacter sp.]|nr:M28 family peptidase [Candidatus Angelobacter sp.]